MYGFLAVCYFIGIVIALRIVRSPVGAIFSAIRDNPLRARARWATRSARYKLAAFVIAAAYAGFAGGLLGVLQGFMPPDAFTFDTSGQLVMQTAIGGTGTLFGPLLGAAVWLYPARLPAGGARARRARGSWCSGVVFVLLVCFLRRGLIGGLRDLVAALRPRSRIRRRRRRAPPIADGAAAARQRRPAAPRQRGAVLGGRCWRRAALTKSLRRHRRQPRHQLLASTQGELRGIIGPNGAGKSTFFKMLTCEVPPTSGRILFHGRDITGMDVAARVPARPDQELPGQPALPAPDAAREHRDRRAGRAARPLPPRPAAPHRPRAGARRRRWSSTLALVGLTARADVPVAELAYGEKRRLEIGLALATSPSLLLLDEPLAGMSPRERAETVQLLKNIRRGRTLVVVEHDMDAVFELAERITVLHEGALLAEGTPAEIQRNSLVQEAYLGGVAAA